MKNTINSIPLIGYILYTLIIYSTVTSHEVMTRFCLSLIYVWSAYLFIKIVQRNIISRKIFGVFFSIVRIDTNRILYCWTRFHYSLVGKWLRRSVCLHTFVYHACCHATTCRHCRPDIDSQWKCKVSRFRVYYNDGGEHSALSCNDKILGLERSRYIHFHSLYG